MTDFKLAHADIAMVPTLLKVAGVFNFVTTLMGKSPSFLPSVISCQHTADAHTWRSMNTGWYPLVVSIFDSTGIPIKLPVGDLSKFMSRRRHLE